MPSFTWYLLYDRYSSRDLICSNSLIFTTTMWKIGPISFLFYGWRKWGTKRLYNFPKVAQLGISKANIWTQAVWFCNLALSHYGLLCSCSLSQIDRQVDEWHTGYVHQMAPSNISILNLKKPESNWVTAKRYHFTGFEVCLYLMYKSGFVYICIQILYSNLNLILCLYTFK